MSQHPQPPFRGDNDTQPQGQGYPQQGAYSQYGSPAYSYGYGYSSEEALFGQRTLKDYLMIVRERIWLLVLALFVCVVAAVLWNETTEPEYAATGKFKILRGRANVTGGLGNTSLDDKDRMLDDRDFNTQLGSMRSRDMLRRVAKRLNQEESKDTLEPYRKGNLFTGPLSPEEIMGRCYSLQAERQSFMAIVQYKHRSPQIAQKLAGYFLEEIKRANEEETAAYTDPLVERLKIQTDQIAADIQDLNRKKNELVEREKILTLTKDMSTAQTELSQLASVRESDKRAFEETKANWEQLASNKISGKSTAALPFIARDERVIGMLTEISKLEISLSALLKRYTDKHPNVIAAQRQLEQARAELAKAVNEAEAKLEAAYRNSSVNYENSLKRYAGKEEELTKLRKAVTEYESLEKEIRNKEELYNKMIQNYETEKAKRAGLAGTTIIPVESASVIEKPINKSLPIALLVGAALGTALGLGIIALLTALDDRVKSAADIEHFVGIPLLGVIPKISRLDNFTKARSVSTNADRATTESFHAVYSAMKIHDQARKAKTILTTSTTPAEGKSFFTTNLASTFALHGERVIVVDADLRLPNVGRSLKLQGDAGITRYQAGEITLDEAIHKDVIPGMDVLPVGAACKNPTQVLNSKKFAEMFNELKTRYDRVFIDSPPVGAVADALNLMPQVDGALYVIKFNTVKRKTIKGNLRRLRESKVPVFGAVLNQIGLGVASHYTNTYDKSYNRYYHDTDPHAVEVKVS